MPDFDTLPAQVACAGCAVEAECAADALEPINVSEFIFQLTGVRDPEPVPDVVWVCGRRAGMDIPCG